MQEKTDLRLIEAGFPCHQVGAETQRERGASSALPPLYYLHVWWARRPLTPSRAAILASLLPADTDPDWFLRQLGIEKKVVRINGAEWTLAGKILEYMGKAGFGDSIEVSAKVLELLEKENERRAENREIIVQLKEKDITLSAHPVIQRWEMESEPISEPFPEIGDILEVEAVAADPAWFKDLMSIAGFHGIRVPNLYGYDRAYSKRSEKTEKRLTVLDPTSGGGSIPFEGLRLGHNVIANDLNPVASVILHSTLEYPAKFGSSLAEYIEKWGTTLLNNLDNKLDEFFPRQTEIPSGELRILKDFLKNSEESLSLFKNEATTTYLYCRQVICPSCGGDAPLLNTCWLSKEDGKEWGVKIIPDGNEKGGKVSFETYRVKKGRGPNGEDPNFATVNGGVGQCIHCKQAIDSNEIKTQARGESPLGKWKDTLYCVVAVRFQPKLDKNGLPQRFVSGDRKGEIKTEKIRFFRPANPKDLEALELAEKRLMEEWDRWDEIGLIPTELFPVGNDMRPVNYGMTRWCDMFTPRQLLGHLYLIEELNRLKPSIIEELGSEKGRAVVTYLQFAIDKCLTYNGKQSRWHPGRGVLTNAFERHDFSLKWTPAEMIMTGINSGISWGLSQVIDAYLGLSSLMPECKNIDSYLSICNGTAANMSDVESESVDLVCMDPPYYNNVQYAELSDFFYVWQKRTLHDLYPSLFSRRLTDKQSEAVANPVRDGNSKASKIAYETLMAEIFTECRRVMKKDAIMTVMFTHKSQDAWEALTRSLIDSGFIITASVPVESESTVDLHHKNMAAAVSSVFLSCRKRLTTESEPSLWSGFGGAGVQNQVRQAVAEGLEDFRKLDLNPVDEMVASYGRALQVISSKWPVMDGDEKVSPAKAMDEASRVVARHQIKKITSGRIDVDDLLPESAMALTLFGIYGAAEIPFDDVLNLSKSLNISLETKTGNYSPEGRVMGIAASDSKKKKADTELFYAPVVKKGSKLRLLLPEERHAKRLEKPQGEWDMLCGIIMAYRAGDIPLVRAYIKQHAETREQTMIDLVSVWAAEVGDPAMEKEAKAILFGLK